MRAQSIRDLSAAVRGRRRDLGLSQAELAARVGVSRKWIYQFEGGKPTAELALILKVLDGLGLALDIIDEEHVSGGGAAGELDALIEEHRTR